jgi:flagellar biosynthesis protein FlhA
MMRVTTLFQPTILFALALMAIIVMMILPVPSFVVDVASRRPSASPS